MIDLQLARDNKRYRDNIRNAWSIIDHAENICTEAGVKELLFKAKSEFLKDGAESKGSISVEDQTIYCLLGIVIDREMEKPENERDEKTLEDCRNWMEELSRGGEYSYDEMEGAGSLFASVTSKMEELQIYKRMYFQLFNATLDALRASGKEEKDKILFNAQLAAEERFIEKRFD